MTCVGSGRICLCPVEAVYGERGIIIYRMWIVEPDENWLCKMLTRVNLDVATPACEDNASRVQWVLQGC